MNYEENQLKIYTYPEKVLRQHAEEINDIDGGTRNLMDGMIELMYTSSGIGLAGNQVGYLKRLIVFDKSPGQEGKDPAVLINPEIVQAEGEIVHEESCLSVVDFSSEVKRKTHIKVRGVDRNGNPVDIEAEGLLAVCLQHEIDHLNGTLFIDHISSIKRAMYKKKLKKILKGTQ